MKNKTLIGLAIYLLISRIGILLIPILFRIILNPSIILSNILDDSLIRWDAHHYLYISQFGYTNTGDESNYIVFQPLYPFVTHLVNFVINSFLFSSLIVSNISFVLFCLFLYKLLRLDFNKNESLHTIVLLSIFPTAYFFSYPYSESLFLLFAILAIYLSREKNWFKSGVFTGLAILTRHFGIFLIPTLLLEIIIADKKNIFKSIVYYLVPTICAASIYLLINYQVFGNYFAFMKVLKNHWYKSPAFPWVGISSSLSSALSVFNSHSIMIGWMESIAAIFAWIFVPLTFKYTRYTYALYYLLLVIFFTSTGFLLSTPRYILSAFPFFIVLTKLLEKKYLYFSWIIISTILLSLFALTYISGQWAF